LVPTSIGIFITLYFHHIQSKITKQAHDLNETRHKELIESLQIQEIENKIIQDNLDEIKHQNKVDIKEREPAKENTHDVLISTKEKKCIEELLSEKWKWRTSKRLQAYLGMNNTKFDEFLKKYEDSIIESKIPDILGNKLYKIRDKEEFRRRYKI